MVNQGSLLNVQQPFSSAHVTLIEGEQGEGKSITGVARVVDAYFKDSIRVYCQEVLRLNCEVKSYDPRTRIARVRYKGEPKRLLIPDHYKLHSPLQIHANFHLYGLPYYYYDSFSKVLAGLKSGKITNGILVIDEAYIGINARESMSALSRELEKQSYQYRKMRLEVIVITPMARLIDWTARVMPTERIMCSYNEKNGYVTLTIKKKGHKGNKEVTYDSKPYRKYYWTNERITA